MNHWQVNPMDMNNQDEPWIEGYGPIYPFQYVDKETGERCLVFIANTKEAYLEAIKNTK